MSRSRPLRSVLSEAFAKALMQSQAMRSRQDMFHMKHVPWMLMLLSLYASTSSSLHTEDGHTAEMEFTQQQNPALRHKQLQADKKPWFCHNYDCPPYKVRRR